MSRILIIGDEGAIADLEKDYLDLSGFEVEVANDGVTGLDKALNEDYNLLILDLMLPGVDGFEICRKVRDEKNTPIIMVSAKKDDIDKIRGLGLGADDYMTKPFSPSELVARVKAHLARYERLIGSAVEENKVIEIRGLKIDTTARRVWINGEEKPFTTKEFDLLTFLASHPNHVYTKDELFSEIWDMESIGDIATVTVHIKKIREKIEYDTSNPQYIEAIWGVGYRFKMEYGKIKKNQINDDAITCDRVSGNYFIGRYPFVAAHFQYSAYFIDRRTLHGGYISMRDRTCNGHSGSTVYFIWENRAVDSDTDRRSGNHCLRNSILYYHEKTYFTEREGRDPGSLQHGILIRNGCHDPKNLKRDHLSGRNWSIALFIPVCAGIWCCERDWIFSFSCGVCILQCRY